jgi:Right handed beta helix region
MNARTMLILSLLVGSLAWLTAATAEGATYYVAKTGSNSRSCSQAQSASAPKLTIAAGLACVRAGDTLVISPGTYAEGINDTIPSGTSTSTRTRVIGLNGARWTLRPGSISQCFSKTAAIRVHSRKYVEIADVIVDGAVCTGPSALVIYSGASNNNVLRNSEVKGARYATGILFQGGTTSRITLSNVSSHDHGNDNYDHCFYPTGNDHVLENVTGYNCSGHGLHLFHNDDNKNNRNTIKSSKFYNNASWGIGIYQGSGNQVYSNTVTNNGRKYTHTGGIRLSADTTKLYSNTITNHVNAGYCIRIDRSAYGSTVHNNVCSGNWSDTTLNLGTNTSLVAGAAPSLAAGAAPQGPVNLQVSQ